MFGCCWQDHSIDEVRENERRSSGKIVIRVRPLYIRSVTVERGRNHVLSEIAA